MKGRVKIAKGSVEPSEPGSRVVTEGVSNLEALQVDVDDTPAVHLEIQFGQGPHVRAEIGGKIKIERAHREAFAPVLGVGHQSADVAEAVERRAK